MAKKSKKDRKKEKEYKKKGLSQEEIARKKEFDEMKAIWYRSGTAKLTKSNEYTDMPRRNFVEPSR